MSDKFDSFRPNVGVTVASIILKDGQLQVLTYMRPLHAETFPDCLALPNGFMNIEKHSSIEDAAYDALQEKTGAKAAKLEQLHSFSGTYIDPSRRLTVNIGFVAMLKANEVYFGDDYQSPNMENVQWMPIKDALAMDSDMFAFNHKEVLEKALDQILRAGSPILVAVELLPDEFTIPELRMAYQLISNNTLNDNSLRNKIFKTGFIEPTGTKRSIKSVRPADLYRKNQSFKGTVVLE
ncbi:NUDIX hydrolase [Vibrio splendidus]|nr:NUDIX domain-containing protein [Vibrio splendidus]MCC4883111.1 NUDIX domain-containing protein [Vibrio splendidus]